MRSDNPKASGLRLAFAGVAVALVAVLPGCEGGAGSGGGLTTIAAPRADYPTESAHFGALQKAALSADYPSFAKHLGAEEQQATVDMLSQRFGGKPFDVYTEMAKSSANGHRRLVELRTTSGRLYLFIELAKVPGGWNIAAHELSPNRTAVLSRMDGASSPSG